jgi:hypothetical protein
MPGDFVVEGLFVDALGRYPNFLSSAFPDKSHSAKSQSLREDIYHHIGYGEKLATRESQGWRFENCFWFGSIPFALC